MERSERQIGLEGSTIEPPTFREWLWAVVLLPITLKSLAEEIAHLVEVHRDFTTGFYTVFKGSVRYGGPDPAAPKNNSANSIPPEGWTR